MRLLHSRSLGSLNVDGDHHLVIYDIPGMFDRSAGAAGGLVWFREEARASLPATTRFQLLSTAGVRVTGFVVKRHGLSAAVVVEPPPAFGAKGRRVRRDYSYIQAAAGGRLDNESVRRVALLVPQGT